MNESVSPDDSIVQAFHVHARIRTLFPNAVRITHADPRTGLFPPDRPWIKDVFTQPAGTESFTNSVITGVKERNGMLQAADPAGKIFFEEILPPGQYMKKLAVHPGADVPALEVRLGIRRIRDGIRMAVRIHPGERFYGWGEWFNAFSRDRGRLRLNIRDSIALIQHKATYSAIPMFYSSRGYAFFLLNSHMSDWNLDPDRGVLTIDAAGPPADYILIYGPEFKTILRTYTALTGRPPLLPRWAFGLWVTSYPQGHQDGVLELVLEHRKRNLPLDAVILDYHWEEAFHNFRWRKGLIPDPDGMIASLRDQGIKLGLILTPFLNRIRRRFQKFFLYRLARNLPPGHHHDDERVKEEYNEALGKRLFAHPNARWWFGRGGMMDFAHTPAAEWWNARLRPLYDQGVAFFKNDDGEYLPYNGRSETGLSGSEYHNLYGLYYGRAMYDGMRALDNRRPLIYARTVWAGSQRYPAVFLGDQKPTCEDMARTMRAGLNLGLLGFAYWTADVFGLDGRTTEETHIRYAQWALLSPVARYFLRPSEVDDTRFPWAHGPKAENNFRVYSELRYRLLPYFTALAFEAWITGLPIMRPLLLEYQDDERFADVYDQVLLGERLMICPVLESGAEERSILIPEGVWHDFWTDTTWTGPSEIIYPAPLERLPLLVKGGGMLPMGPVLQCIPEGHTFDPLELHLWPPYSGSSDFYEDDGSTRAYMDGEYSVTRVTSNESDGRLRVEIGPVQGRFPGRPEKRTATVCIHRFRMPHKVTVDGKPAGSVRHEADMVRITAEYRTADGMTVELG